MQAHSFHAAAEPFDVCGQWRCCKHSTQDIKRGCGAPNLVRSHPKQDGSEANFPNPFNKSAGGKRWRFKIPRQKQVDVGKNWWERHLLSQNTKEDTLFNYKYSSAAQGGPWGKKSPGPANSMKDPQDKWPVKWPSFGKKNGLTLGEKAIFGTLTPSPTNPKASKSIKKSVFPL